MFTFGYKKLSERPYPEPYRIKIVLVGDNGCGKTCLLTSICLGPYERIYHKPRVFGSHVADIIVDDIVMEIIPWDTVGDEGYAARMRPIAYPDTDVFLLCFSIDSQQSLRNVETKWILEVKAFCPTVPVILIGNKRDLRDQFDKKLTDMDLENKDLGDSLDAHGERNYKDFVTQEQGEEMAEKVGAFAYLECSAKTMDGINIIFPTAANVALKMFQSTRGRSKCSFL